MNRIDFTNNICKLLTAMMLENEHPIIDYCKRSFEEQKRLFDAGLSKCDGVKNVSAHQLGVAMDIYFIVDGKLSDPLKGWQYWHDYWQQKGGKPMIEWDKGHFE